MSGQVGGAFEGREARGMGGISGEIALTYYLVVGTLLALPWLLLLVSLAGALFPLGAKTRAARTPMVGR